MENSFGVDFLMIVIAIVLVAVGFLFGFQVGHRNGTEEFKKKAVAEGVAVYYNNEDVVGGIDFRWKECDE